MNNSNCQTSACRYCRHFTPEGRRGGNCQQLNVPVRGGWKACPLAIPAFAPSWEGLGLWQYEPLTAIETQSNSLETVALKESRPNLSVVEDDLDQDLALA
ncbi:MULTISPECIES: hypothetical protein [unclassified Roseofilum]|uniref:hypothetical protein n=1 Tax=unclassified Roseofilum TaxID=2620099 RepID=UPI000E9C790E|nr:MULTISPECIES: hypothetical protein [unclassified Roseofilum]HBQ99607.1 hypothetical protein [Cyanobacteria bacterium UBA11691]MBP0008187.1 hypothetical protein [Roseofilum sp. Belize Diploria]MBP0015080.1 hypothetical protein [Roseofilum sp. SID3]MBP0024284.1 hypothetical protein [Roseofilum sp. SID2]MBP0033693.1 hypothetical protein [Roseofilum sp. Belize BBD 4]